MVSLSQPAEMVFEGELGVVWRRVKNSLLPYIAASGCKMNSEEDRSAVLFHCVGEQAPEKSDVKKAECQLFSKTQWTGPVRGTYCRNIIQ